MRLFTVIFLLFMLPSLSFADCANHVEAVQSIGDMKAAFRCLNNEIRELKQQLKQGGAGSVVVNQIPGLPEPTISQTTTENGIKYDVLGCSNKRGKVECELRVTRLGADKRFHIGNYTKIDDENSNEHGVSYIQIANKSSRSSVKKTLISNVPTKVILRFNSVSSQATRITVLNVLNLHRDLLVSFRDIALQR